jgi:small subunit ribosomal protein S8e
MRLGRKVSGGRYKKFRKKKKYESPGIPRLVRLGEEKKKALKTRGGEGKPVLLATNKANVFDLKSKKSKVTKIKAVLEIPSNRYLKNVMMKGTIIDTELGKARITNRPGQEGSVEAVLI